MRVLDLFSGIGGFSLAAAWMNWQTVGFCEIDPFCQKALRKNWPEAWIHDDVQTLSGKLVRERCGAVDIIVGGFPCQDISAAGKGAGIRAGRSGLWWEMRRVIAEIEPAWVVIENVPALRTRGADAVLASLEAIGYECWPFVVGAWAVGSPHRRDRVWIVGYSSAKRRSAGYAGNGTPRPESGEPGDAGRGVGQADAERSRLEGQRRDAGRTAFAESRHVGSYRWPARPGEEQFEWEQPRLAYSDKSRLASERRSGRLDDRSPESGDGLADSEGDRQRQGRTGRSDSGGEGQQQFALRVDGLADSEGGLGCEPQTGNGRPVYAGGGPEGGRRDAGQPESSMGASANGISGRLARWNTSRWRREALKAVGNSVVPQVVYEIFKAIDAHDG